MGSGDSFTFGTVSYPENVLKIVQDSFNRHCSGRKIEIMNFSLPSAGVSEYRLGAYVRGARYKPDRVVVHFYLGNDGLDLITTIRANPVER